MMTNNQPSVVNKQPLVANKKSLIAWTCILALGYCMTARSQPISIESGSNPAADVIAIPKGSKEKAVKDLPRIITSIMRRSHVPGMAVAVVMRSEEHTSEHQSLMRISYAGLFLKKK